MAEPKGKEAYRAEDCGGCVFMSNHDKPVLIENDDRRYGVTGMNSKYKHNRKYFTRLAAAVKDERVQRAYFSMLVHRNLDKFNMRNIPDTDIRFMFKANKCIQSHSEIPGECRSRGGLRGLVQHPKLEPDASWYSMKTVRETYFDYLDEMNIPKRYHPWNRTERRLMKGGIAWKRVIDRSNGGTRKQVKCYQLCKSTVRDLHRRMLDTKDWDYPDLKSVEGIIADQYRINNRL